MIGKNLLADFYGVSPSTLSDTSLLERCLREAAVESLLTPLNDPVLHQFQGGGITGFLLLRESHISFHSYPEHGFLALDVFTCGLSDPEKVVEVFRKYLSPSHHQIVTAVRGGGTS